MQAKSVFLDDGDEDKDGNNDMQSQHSILSDLAFSIVKLAQHAIWLIEF